MLRWLAMLMGPIFAKEMIEMARRKRYYINRVLYGLALLLALLAIWEENRWRLGNAGPGIIRIQARMAEELFLGVAGVQYGAVLLFVPLFLAGVVASEREEKTLDLLLTTPLNDREIVLGKLASRVAVLILLIFSGLPVLSLVMLMGGIDPVGLGLVTVATLLMVLFCAAHAIYFSTITKSPIGALVRTYWWLAIWLAGVPMAGGMILGGILSALPWTMARPTAGAAACLALFIHPVGPFIVAVVPEAYDFVAAILGDWFFPFTLLVPVLWSLFLIWQAVRRLRGDVTPFWRLLQRIGVVSRFQLRLQSLQARLRSLWHRETVGWADDRLLRPVGNLLAGEVGNAIWQRSRWVRVYDRERIIGGIQWAGWAAALFFFFLIALCDPRSIDDDECSMSFLGLTWMALALLTAILAGTSLVGDRRRGFLEQVLVTPLTGREVIDGTFLAVWEHMRRVALLPLVLGFLFCVTGASTPLGLFCSFMTAAITCALIAMVGVGCSLPATTLPGAMAPAFIFPLVITAGTPMLIVPFEHMHGPVLWLVTIMLIIAASVWVRRQMNAASVCCYLTAIHLGLVCAATCWTWNGREDELPAIAINPAVWSMIVLQRRLIYIWPSENGPWFLALLLYWLASAGSFFWARWWLIRHFDRLAGRAEQPEAQQLPAARAEPTPPVPAGAAVHP